MAAAAVARADAPVPMDWRAPPECPDEAFVQGRIAEYAQRVKLPPGWQASADVTRRTDGRWAAQIAVHTASGEGHRSIAAGSCREIADAVALIVTLASEASPPSSDPPTAPSTETPSPAETPRPREASVPVSPVTEPLDAPPPVRSASSSDAPGAARRAPPGSDTSSPARWAPAGGSGSSAPTRRVAPARAGSFALASGVFGDLGTLPSAAPGVSAIVTWLSPVRVVWVELGGALSGIESATGGSTGGARIWMRAGSLGACAGPRSKRWRIGACVEPELVSLRANGVGLASGRSGDATWVTVRARSSAAYVLAEPWTVRFDLGAGVNLDPPQFVALRPDGTQGTALYRPSTVTGRASIGVAVDF